MTRLRLLLAGIIVVPTLLLTIHAMRGLAMPDLLFEAVIVLSGMALGITACVWAFRIFKQETAVEVQSRLESQRRQLAEIKRHRLEALGQLTAGMAHDFNNLLAIIMGNAEHIIAGGDRTKAVNIIDAGSRGATLLGHLLSFSRRQIWRTERYDLNVHLAEIVSKIQASIAEGVVLQLSSIDPEIVCTLDRIEFEIAVLNIIHNAFDAMPQGGRLLITTAIVFFSGSDIRTGRYARITFEDDGEGMLDEVRERAFEPFFTTRELTHGRGLGLSQVYGFAKQSGGDATIDSEVTQGTKVTLYLPMHEVPATPKFAIVAVDDTIDILDVVGPTLQNNGYRTHCTCDPQEALSIAETNTIDLLLTDIVMPAMSGVELAQRMQQRQPTMKVLLMTGFSGHTADYPVVRKPFRLHELLERIQRLLGETPGRWTE